VRGRHLLCIEDKSREAGVLPVSVRGQVFEWRRGWIRVFSAVVRAIHPFICCIGLTLTASVGAAPAGDDFSLTGNYTQNVPCKGDGSDPAKLQVKISAHKIDSKVGVCTILHSECDGKSVNAQLECQFAAGTMLGEVTFTMQPDGTVKMVDRDQNYRSVLYRCPQ
jgi:hypothetical protein